MFDIKIKVNGNGTLTTGKSNRLRLGTQHEVGRVRFVFDVDSSVEGTFQYIKFVKEGRSYLYRVSNKVHVLNKSVLANPGVWLISFISSTTVITDNKITGNYAYISEPIEAVVIEGIFQEGLMSEETLAISQLYSMAFTELKVPECVTSIGDYFLYDSRKTFDLIIGSGVKFIGGYTFYKSTLRSLTFEEDSELETLSDYAFYNLTLQKEVLIPRSVKYWGKHCFEHTSTPAISFESRSQIDEIGSYGFWNMDSIVSIKLPDNLKTFSGNTYVISHCDKLEYLWIPNTLTATIPANAIMSAPALTTIELQDGFNVSANFSKCTELTAESIEKMLYALKNLSGTSAKTLTLGETNLAKLNASQIAIATNKNWTLS